MALSAPTHSHHIGVTIHCIAVAVAGLLFTGTMAAAEPPVASHAVYRDLLKRGPNIDGEIRHYRVNHQLPAAFRVALKRVRRLRSCRALFEHLDADGLEVLATTTYIYGETDRFRSVCDVACAFTTVGGSTVGLCSQFGRIPVEDAAQVLIHEALHGAGLSERPFDPDGLTPDEIDEMVAHACGF